MKLVLSVADMALLKAEAIRAFPEECCGLITGHDQGDDQIVTEIVAAANVSATDRTRNFEIDPGVRIRLEVKARGSATRIIGHFHSHPKGKAAPSAQDLAMAYEPGLIWVIMSLDGAEEDSAVRIAAYRLKSSGDAFTEIPIQTIC